MMRTRMELIFKLCSLICLSVITIHIFDLTACMEAIYIHVYYNNGSGNNNINNHAICQICRYMYISTENDAHGDITSGIISAINSEVVRCCATDEENCVAIVAVHYGYWILQNNRVATCILSYSHKKTFCGRKTIYGIHICRAEVMRASRK